MARSITFIHAADLHLGAPFRGLRSSSPEWADVLVHAIPDAFARIIEAALSNAVDFVVIAGDLFDDSRPSYADFSTLVTGLGRLNDAHIPVYFVTGNHDPYTSWDNGFSALPPNAHLLGPDHAEFACFERDGEALALLGGRGYYSQAWPAGVDISEGISRETASSHLGKQAPFMVGILHTGLDVDPTRSPVDPKELLRRDVDYWACGHIHQSRIIPDSQNPRVVFAGCPQGRAIHETGDHGCFKVTLIEGQPNQTEFIPCAQVVWYRASVDVSACDTVSAIQELITNTQFAANAQAHCQRMVFRFTLKGRTSLHETLTPHVLEDLRVSLNDSYPFFYVDALVNHTLSVVDRVALAAEGLFPATYLDAVAACCSNKVETLRTLERSFYDRDLTLPSTVGRHFDEVCDDAQELVLDLLSREEA